jgi:hypothetical protein
MPARTLSLGVALFLFAALPAADAPPELRAAPHPKGYVCHRPSQPIVIDGKHEKAWDDAPWSEEFVDISTDVKPRHRTRVKMLHDDAALYIFAELDEPHVWGTLKDHDSVIYHDNDFEVFIDPDGDNHAYGELELNALNTTWDLLLTKPYRDAGLAVNAWEIKGLKTAVQVNGTLNDPTDTDRGWTVEIRWPFAGLAELSKTDVPPKDGDQWRINFSRVQWKHAVREGKYVKDSKTEDNWVWSPQGAIDMHRPERWGYLQFSTAKPGKTRFEPDADWPTKDLLHRVYYAERLHHKEHKRFTPDMEKLNLGGVAVPLSGAVQLEAMKNGFEASLARPADASGKPRRFSINQDGRLRTE